MQHPADIPRDAGRSAPDLGARLRSLREKYGLSQRELARRTGIANATISLIEQERVSPSVSSLKKLLAGFPVSLAEFFGEGAGTGGRVFYGVDDFVEIGGNRVSLRQLGEKRPGRSLQVLHERYEPGGDTGERLLAHEGEEAGVVVRGSIEITVGARTRCLGPGEGYYFESRLPHRFRNTGTEICEIISVCTPPTF